MPYYYIEELDRLLDREEGTEETLQNILEARVVVYGLDPIEAALAYADRVYQLYAGEDIDHLAALIQNYDCA